MLLRLGEGSRGQNEGQMKMSETELQETDDPGEVEIVDQIVDLEEYAKAGKQPPLSKGYRFRVNGEAFVVKQPVITGREVLTVAGLLPAEDYTLRLKMVGGKPEKVGLDEKVDLRRRGIEKFKALPRDQTEG